MFHSFLFFALWFYLIAIVYTTESPLVKINFFKTTDCSGAPIRSIYFPINYSTTKCFSWTGHSGENSAKNFQCDVANNKFVYTQWAAFDCQGGQNPQGTLKDASNTCKQDIPPTLYGILGDFTCCTSPNNTKCQKGGELFGEPKASAFKLSINFTIISSMMILLLIF